MKSPLTSLLPSEILEDEKCGSKVTRESFRGVSWEFVWRTSGIKVPSLSRQWGNLISMPRRETGLAEKAGALGLAGIGTLEGR